MLQDIHSILSRHALGQGLLNSNNLDTNNHKLLVDILADDIIVKYGRCVFG